MNTLATLLNLEDFAVAAEACLDTAACDYFRGGAGDEISLAANRTDFDRLRLAPRVLVDVSQRTPRTAVLGTEIAMPVVLAPSAFHGLAHAQGETAGAQAARAHDTIMTLSTFSTTDVEQVAQAAAPGKLWFQLYVYKDRELSRALVQRVEAAGATALVLTVDAPLLGIRERDIRNRFRLPPHLMVRNMFPREHAAGTGEGSELQAHFASALNAALTWRDIDWLRSISTLPLVIKGILRADDALRALDCGAAGIVVSNHGGRQLDTAISGIAALPAIADALQDRMDILVDGGVRRGTDIVKALALGARAVMLGRPVLWGLACGGAAGVSRVLDILRAEFDLALALCGCRNVGEITRDLVV